MEDMDEYMRSLEIIADCNHIDEIEGTNIMHMPISYDLEKAEDYE